MDDLSGYVKVLRERIKRAEESGQVEIHVDLGTMDLLVQIAEVVLAERSR